MRVRSALMRVRWKDIPVRRDASSVLMAAASECDVIRGLTGSSMGSPFDNVHLLKRAEDHLDRKRDLKHAQYCTEDLQDHDREAAHDPARIDHCEEIQHHDCEQDQQG